MANKTFATIQDLEDLWRILRPDETKRAEKLLEVVSDTLRVEAKKVGKTLDTLVSEDDSYANVVKSVTVDIVARTLMTSTDQEPATQSAESALGYSQSFSFLVPGGGLFVKTNELARLGFKRQRRGVIELYE